MLLRKAWQIATIFVILAMLLVACQPAPAPTQAPAEQKPAEQKPAEQKPAEQKPAEPTKPPEKPAEPTKPPEKPAEPTKAPAKAQPTELKIGVFGITPAEEPWNAVMLQALDRIIKEKPHGLTISYDFSENIATPDGERVMRELASSGKYGIVIGHSTYPDAIKNVSKDFPDMLFAVSGSGNEALGGNAYWGDVYVQEPAYLEGIIAGMMTKTNTIGAIGAFPYPNVNLPINAYFEGAKSVNPKVKVKVAYIESWFDPPKAKEQTLAQISAGADFIYAERFGPFEAATQKKVLAFGHFSDQYELAPDTVVASSLALWDPVVKTYIDAWWEHTVNNKPYDALKDKSLYFLMKDGGADISPYHNFDSKLPKEVKDKVEEVRKAIKEGKFTVPMNEKEAKSD